MTTPEAVRTAERIVIEGFPIDELAGAAPCSFFDERVLADDAFSL